MATQDDLEKLFGPAIFSYTDAEALADGVLIPLQTAAGRDTGHRITANAFQDLKRHAGGRQDDAGFVAYVLRELLPLAPEAYRKDRVDREFLKTGYDFRVRKDGRLWYVPNEVGGVTIMKPEDW